MMRVLLDTNIPLDIFCERQPFAAAAKLLWEKAENGQIQASVSATTITTIHYVACKHIGNAKAIQAVNDTLATFEVAPIDSTVLKLALARGMRDFEDAVQDAAAEC